MEKDYEKELANNIIKKMKKYNITSDHVGSKNLLKKYVDKKVSESVEEQRSTSLWDLLYNNNEVKEIIQSNLEDTYSKVLNYVNSCNITDSGDRTPEDISKLLIRIYCRDKVSFEEVIKKHIKPNEK